MCSFDLLMMDGKPLKHVERLTEIKKLRIVASCWLYSANILAMHGPMNVKPYKYLVNYAREAPRIPAGLHVKCPVFLTHLTDIT